MKKHSNTSNTNGDQAPNTEPVNETAETHLPELAADAAIESLAEAPAAAPSESQETTQDNVESLRAQLAEAETKALRYQADLENFRRRARRDVEEQLKYANSGLISDLLDALDNLQRALELAPAENGAQDLIAGVRIVAEQIANVLKKYGCRPIEAVGNSFDPNYHQAVQSIEAQGQPANQVLQELRTGYLLYDRVIRPAQVVVAKPAAEK